MELTDSMTQVVATNVLVGDPEAPSDLVTHFKDVTTVVGDHEAEGRVVWTRTLYHQNPVSPAMLVVTEIESRQAPKYPDYDAGVQYIGEPQKPPVE